MWICPKCAERLDDQFDTCWKCAGSGELINPAPPKIGEETAMLQSEAPKQAGCSKCGSNKVIPDVPIPDQGDGSSGQLNIAIARNPHALLFRDMALSDIRATICGECGHVELWVREPGKLYDAYLQSMGQDGDSTL